MERFIVGSGRCGSTLLTTMLAKHPDVAMFSEFWAAVDRTVWYRDPLISGPDFRLFLERSPPLADIMIRRGRREKEIMADTEGLEALPPLFVGFVHTLSATPDLLYAEILEEVARYPARPLSEQVVVMFDWLTDRLGKSAWIERSGPSIQHLPQIVGMYPNARFVHLHRDGAEAALSMHRHQYFQLEASFFFDPPARTEIEATEYGGKPISESDPFSRRLANILPVEKFGEYWSYMQVMGCKGLMRLNPTQVLDIQFEELVSRPAETMLLIADFFGLPKKSEWVDEAARLVDGIPPSRFNALSASEQSKLSDACRIGRVLSGREELPWTTPTLELINEVASVSMR